MMIKQQAEAMLQADFNLNEEQKIAWALYRVSTLKQADDKDDIPMQKIACRQYAGEHGWLLQNEVCEAGVSGYKKTAAQRDAIRLLLEAAEKGQFQILLVYMSDRIGRRGMETAMLCEKLTELGIEIWSVKEDQIKFDDDMQYLLNTIRFSMAKLESGKTSIRIKTRMEQLTLEGKYTGRKLPYGYRLVPTGEYTKKGRMRNRVEINPQEAEVVRIIFDKTIREGLGSYRLSAYLNEQGYRNQKGKPFEHNLINRTLKNRLYCGYFVWGNTVSPCLKELVIISQQDFDDAQKILAERSQKDEKKRHIALNTKGSSLLSGNLFCGACGSRMIATTAYDSYFRKRDGQKVKRETRRYICYHGTRKLNDCNGQASYLAEKVDNNVRKILSDYLKRIKTTPQDAAIEQRYQKMVLEQKQQKKDLVSTVEKLKMRLTELSSEIAKSLTGDSKFTTDMLTMAIESTKSELFSATGRLDKCDKELRDKEAAYKSLDANYKKFVSWADVFDGATLEEQKMIACQLIRSVYLNRGYEMQIVFNFDYEQFLQS